MERGKIWLTALVAVLLVAGWADVALAQGYLPDDWRQPMDVGGNAVVRAIYAIARFVIPIVGVVVILHGMIALISAVYDAFRGKEVHAGTIVKIPSLSSVVVRAIEVFIGIFLVAIPLTGMWVPLTEGLLELAQRVVDSIAGALRSPGGP